MLWTLTVSIALGQNVVITEVGRSKGVTDEDNVASDWIELYNAEPSPVNLEGWRLDNSQSGLPMVFPRLWIDPGAFLVLYASEKDRVEPDAPIHTPFKIPSDKKVTLTLFRSNQTVSASVFMSKTDVGASHALLMTGRATFGAWTNLGLATPGGANWQPGVLVPAAPATTVPTGIHFTRALTVALTSEPETEIHYTLDGSNPNAASPVYTQPLTLTRTTIVRARARFRVTTGDVFSESGDYRFVLADPELSGFNSSLPVLLLTGGDPVAGQGGQALRGTITLLDSDCARNSPSGLPGYLG
jgi:hypothetical protein